MMSTRASETCEKTTERRESQIVPRVCTLVLFILLVAIIIVIQGNKPLPTPLLIPGSEDSPTRGSCDWLHVWKRDLLCGHGVQEC